MKLLCYQFNAKQECECDKIVSDQMNGFMNDESSMKGHTHIRAQKRTYTTNKNQNASVRRESHEFI